MTLICYRLSCLAYSPVLVQALDLRSKHFTSHIAFARHLADGLVGSAIEGTDRRPLKSGSWGFVFSDNNVYIGQGSRVSHLYFAHTILTPHCSFSSLFQGSWCRKQPCMATIGELDWCCFVPRCSSIRSPSSEPHQLVQIGRAHV